MRMSEVPFTLSLEDAVSALSIAPYFPFPRVIPVRQEVTENGTSVESVIWFEADPHRSPVCSGCGQRTGRVHSTTMRRVVDLPLAQARVGLMVPQRKVRCPRCGVRTERHEFLSPYRRATMRFERAVAEFCRVLPIQHVAAHFGVTWHTVKEIDQRRLEREVGTPCYDGLRLLAVDEVAVHKGHRYLTTVLDLETGRMVWIGADRTKATLLRFFAELTPEQRAAIEAVATDMASGYREAVHEACPHAALVYDLFHAVAKFSREVIDRVRVDESKQRDEAGRQLIKGSRYLLLKNAEHLVGDQPERLDALLAANHHLHTVYLRAQRPVEAPLDLPASRVGPPRGGAVVCLSGGQWAPRPADVRQEFVAPCRGHHQSLSLPAAHRPAGGHQQQDQSHQANGLWVSRRRLLHAQDQRRLSRGPAPKSAMNLFFLAPTRSAVGT